MSLPGLTRHACAAISSFPGRRQELPGLVEFVGLGSSPFFQRLGKVGKQFLNFVNISTGTWSLTVLSGQGVTATATNTSTSNTSQFSGCKTF